MHKWIRSTQKRFSLTPSVAMAAFAPVQRLAPFRSPVVSWARARPRAEPWQRIPTQAGDQTLQKKSSNILWHFMTFYDAMRCRNHSKWGMVRHGEAWWGMVRFETCQTCRWLPVTKAATLTGCGFLVPPRENCHGRGRHEPPLDLWLVHMQSARHLNAKIGRHIWYMVHALPSCSTDIITSRYM